MHGALDRRANLLQMMDTKKLMKALKAANDNLKKFSHVNKKALDQYVSFSEQRETILKRKGEIDAAQTAIKELIEGLDQQKDEVGGGECVCELCATHVIVDLVCGGYGGPCGRL